jgi:hypothetical protein
MKKFFLFVFSLIFLLPSLSFAVSQDEIMQKIEALSKELQSLKQQLNEIKEQEAQKEERIVNIEEKTVQAPEKSWLEIGGDYRARLDVLSGKTHDAFVITNFNPVAVSPLSGRDVKNDSLLLNRFGLNLKAKATEDIQVKARLLMYKVWGHESSEPVAGPGSAFFADKFFLFDGNLGHVPSDNILRVDQAYATWSNIFGAPVWFSVGRRPSTGGIPSNIRQNTEKPGTAGVPGLLIDYAFDGATIGFAPDIDALPGAYAKICYGRGFDSGFRPNNGLKDVDFMGINIVPYDTDNLHVELQWDRAFNIFAFPENRNFALNPMFSNTNLGDIDQFGLLISGKIENIGPGDLNLFANVAMSKTHPNNNTFGYWGLLWDSSTGKQDHSGYAYYLGARYDIKSTGTKIGAEYNWGSKYWITFGPASDDLWTGKLGVRGNVYEVYVIQELNKKPIAKRGKAFFRLGYQYYDFKYTGSNNWVGAPYKISDLAPSSPSVPLLFEPLKKATDIYLTFDVLF